VGATGAYDSAEECEAVKNSMMRVEHSNYEKTAEHYIKEVGAKEDPPVLRLQRLLECSPKFCSPGGA
jgi:hypothetical protein